MSLGLNKPNLGWAKLVPAQPIKYVAIKQLTKHSISKGDFDRVTSFSTPNFLKGFHGEKFGICGKNNIYILFYFIIRQLYFKISVRKMFSQITIDLKLVLNMCICMSRSQKILTHKHRLKRFQREKQTVEDKHMN